MRARLDADAPPLAPVDPTDPIAPAKIREIHKQQRTAAIVSVLYGSLWAIGCNGFLRIRRSLPRKEPIRRPQRRRADAPVPAPRDR